MAARRWKPTSRYHRPDSEHDDILDGRARQCGVRIRNVATRVHHIVNRGLNGPARYNLRLIGEREIEFVIADRLWQAGVEDSVSIECRRVARDFAVEKGRSQLVV